MNRSLIIILFLLGIGFSTYAQQEAQYTQYFFNTMAYNPAYVGAKEYMSIGVLHRQQWIGLEGAPVTESAFLTAPVGLNVGLGGSFEYDQIGPTTTATLNFAYAYKVKFGSTGKLSLSLQGGIMNWRANWDDLVYKDPQATDPSFNEGQANFWKPNFGVGIYYNTERFFAGVSVPRILEWSYYDNSTLSSGVEEAQMSRHLYASVGGVIPISGDVILLRPALLIKNVGLLSSSGNAATSLGKVNAPTSVDLDLAVWFHDQFWVGGAFRTSIEAFTGTSSYDSADIYAGVNIANGFRIGAAYDIPLTKLATVTNGSAEVMLGFDFNFSKDKIVSPRYF